MAGRTFEAKVTAGFLSIPFIIYIQIYFNTPCAHGVTLQQLEHFISTIIPAIYKGRMESCS